MAIEMNVPIHNEAHQQHCTVVLACLLHCVESKISEEKKNYVDCADELSKLTVLVDGC